MGHQWSPRLVFKKYLDRWFELRVLITHLQSSSCQYVSSNTAKEPYLFQKVCSAFEISYPQVPQTSKINFNFVFRWWHDCAIYFIFRMHYEELAIKFTRIIASLTSSFMNLESRLSCRSQMTMQALQNIASVCLHFNNSFSASSLFIS